ncbi:tolloid-like protein 1 [Oculina patagonica]
MAQYRPPFFAQYLCLCNSYEKTLTSPNYPSNPENGLNCNWLLEVDNGFSSGGYIVKVTFTELDVKFDSELKFYDGNSTASSILGSYSGRTHPEVIYSTSRYLYVNFRTDDSYAIFTYKGFSLSFSAVKEDDVTCIWTISVPAGNIVKLTFENYDLNLEPEDCKRNTKDRDYVQIHDGKVPESKELALYCGYYRFMGPSDVYSTGRYMTIIFQSISDGKQSSRGFKARFEAVDPQSAVSDHLCFSGNVNNNNLKITASHGTLQSPLRDSCYPPDLSCDWLITVPEGKTVKLSFDTLELELGHTSECTGDYVEVLDGNHNNSESKGRFCGYQIPDDIRSHGRYMLVRFRSDSDQLYHIYSGFNASFIAEDKPTVAVPANSKEVCYPGNINNGNLKFSGSHGTLQSPQQDFTYPPDSSCDWLITVPEGKIVKLSFDRFALEWSEGCTEDYVEVRDGNDFNSRSKGRFCGLTAPDDIRSSGRYMLVAFRSDSDYSNYGGFKATFTAEDKPSSSSHTVIIVVVTLAFIISLVCCVVCVVKRKKKPNSDADVAIPMTTATISASRTTRPGEVQHSLHPSRQPPSAPALNLNPLPPVGYAPVPTNPEVPPPAYPYPLESPPPYPGDESAPQYPPPGQSYPWQQTNSSAPAESSAPTEGPVEPSAPPESP